MRLFSFRLASFGLRTWWPVGVAGLVTWALATTGLLTPLVQADYRLRFRLRGQRPWAESVVVIAIDDPSLADLGAFPWPRRYYARLLQMLEDASPQAIVLNLVMSDPSEDDRVLADAIAAHQAVMLGIARDVPCSPSHNWRRKLWPVVIFISSFRGVICIVCYR